MPFAAANGIRIAYEAEGRADGEAVLVIPGLAGQLTAVPAGFVKVLASRGFRVVWFDNRDVGLSTMFDAAGTPDFEAVRTAVREGRPPPVAYALADMAADAVGLLNALGIRAAHVMGGSMGGAIAQLVAVNHPDRVRSLTSFMAGSGNPDLPPPAADVLKLMSEPPPGDATAVVEQKVRLFQRIGSPGHPTPVSVLRARFAAEHRRSYNPAGAARQSAAIIADGDRRARLRAVRAPTVVIHGAADPLVPVEAGRDVAAHIPDAELRVVPGMGHDFPDTLAPTVADAVCAAAARAAAA